MLKIATQHKMSTRDYIILLKELPVGTYIRLIAKWQALISVSVVNSSVFILNKA